MLGSQRGGSQWLPRAAVAASGPQQGWGSSSPWWCLPPGRRGGKHSETFCALPGWLLHLSCSQNPGSSQPRYPVCSYSSFLCETGNGTKSITLFSNSKPPWDGNSDPGCSSESSQSPSWNFLSSGDMVTVMLYSTVLNTISIFILENHVQRTINHCVAPVGGCWNWKKNSSPRVLWETYLVFVVFGYYLL